jgi:Kelch motif
MPDLHDRLADASNELASMPVADRPFVARSRRVGPAVVVVGLLAGAGGLGAVARSRNTPDSVHVANGPSTTVTSTVTPSAATLQTVAATPPTAGTAEPAVSTTAPVALTKPERVISGSTGGLAWSLDVSTENNGTRCLQFIAEATPRTLCLTAPPDEWAGVSFVVRTPHLMAALGQALPSEIKGPITASRVAITPVTALTVDGTMFAASVTPVTDPIVRLPSGEECDYAGILDAIERDFTVGYQPTHLLNVAVDHCRGDIAAGSSRASEPFAAQTAFRIFKRQGGTWTAGGAGHMNSCFDLDAGTPDCVKLGYEPPPAAQAPLQSWDSLPNTGLSTRILPLAAAMGDQVLVAGGSKDWNNVAVGDFKDGRVLDAAGTRWQEIPDALATLSSESASAWTGKELLILAASRDLLSFDPSTKAWTTLGRFPGTARISSATAWIAGEFYVFGGYDPVATGNGDTPPRSDGFAYSVTNKTWRTLPSAPAALGQNSSFKSTVRGTTWIIAGRGKEQALGIYDTKTNTWLQAPPVAPDQQVVIVGTEILLAAVDFQNPTPTSRLNDANQFVPTGDTVDFLWGGNNSATYLWVVDGHWVGDSGPAMTNGRAIRYRTAGGDWINLGSPTTSGVDIPVQTASGRLITTDGVNASQLKLLTKS